MVNDWVLNYDISFVPIVEHNDLAVNIMFNVIGEKDIYKTVRFPITLTLKASGLESLDKNEVWYEKGDYWQTDYVIPAPFKSEKILNKYFHFKIKDWKNDDSLEVIIEAHQNGKLRFREKATYLKSSKGIFYLTEEN